jgi:hypothetical protein
MISWTLWWDYFQTFHNPLNLFHANVFYPDQYTLAFSNTMTVLRSSASRFSPPVYARWPSTALRPLAGLLFAVMELSRLARTLTGSQAAAWIAGIAFAFIPFRFHVRSHLHCLFAGWIPLLLEALVLFVLWTNSPEIEFAESRVPRSSSGRGRPMAGNMVERHAVLTKS